MCSSCTDICLHFSIVLTFDSDKDRWKHGLDFVLTKVVRICSHDRHPIARPHGQAMGCLLWLFCTELTMLWWDHTVSLHCCAVIQTSWPAVPVMTRLSSCLYPRWSALSARCYLNTGPSEFELLWPLSSIWINTVKCRYNAVFGVQEIDRVIAVTAL